MRLAFYTVCISPHQLPLAKELLSRLGANNFRYICHVPMERERADLGWSDEVSGSWVLQPGEREDERREWLERADVLFTYIRDMDLLVRRSKAGLCSYYCSERWFKPLAFGLPGWLRLADPRYLRMVWRFVRLARRDPNFRVFPIGVHARRDFRRMGVPDAKMTTWGYFVAPSSEQTRNAAAFCPHDPLRVLWVGRMLRLKNVDILIKSAALAKSKVSLTLVGDGPEKARLQAMKESRGVRFLPPVKIDEVRALMRENDVYVFPSNGYDGWGAVVSEALEEGMLVLGSNEAGASATMLPSSHRFGCRDYVRLAELLVCAAEGKLARVPIGKWTAAQAADRLKDMRSGLDK